MHLFKIVFAKIFVPKVEETQPVGNKKKQKRQKIKLTTLCILKTIYNKFIFKSTFKMASKRPHNDEVTRSLSNIVQTHFLWDFYVLIYLVSII